MLFRGILFVVSCVLGVCVFAQKGLRPKASEKEPAIYLLADGCKDSVVLRWVPSTDILWKMGNKYGYLIERYTIMRNGAMVPGGNKQGRLLNAEPLRPWSKKAMEKLVEQDDYAGVVEEAIYEDDFNLQMRSESPGEIMRQVQQSQNRFGFALLVCDFSPAAARAAALRYVDRKPVAGERYIYRVRIAMPDSLSRMIVYKPGVVVRGSDEQFMRPSIRGLRSEFGDKVATLSWNQEMVHGIYTAFNIERSVNGGPFVKVNPQPYVQMVTSAKGSDKYVFYKDSLPGNYLPCAYRITGLTPFGDSGAWSDTTSGEGLSRLDYRPFFDSIRLAASGGSAVLRWSLPDSIRSRISGIFVSRAGRNQGPYRDINPTPLSPDAVEAIDPLVTGTSNYYRIRIVQNNGDQISSLPYYLPKEDSIAPAVPAGLAGISDKKGIARIHWNPNSEKDLKGYRLFRSQVKGGEYFEVTKGIISDTAFVDSLNLGFTNPLVYYKVLAVDHYYNSSPYSAALAVSRPDTVAPMPAVFTGVTRKDTVVYISFQPGRDRDVRGYSLYRRVKEDGRRQLVAEYPLSDIVVSCSDEPGPGFLGKTLDYELETTDSSGNRSVARSGELFFETGFRRPVQLIKAEADRDKRKITLSWKYDQPGVVRYEVFRAVNADGKYAGYAELPGSALGYEDNGLHVSNTYKYKIMAVMGHGIESVMSREVTVTY